MHDWRLFYCTEQFNQSGWKIIYFVSMSRITRRALCWNWGINDWYFLFFIFILFICSKIYFSNQTLVTLNLLFILLDVLLAIERVHRKLNPSCVIWCSVLQAAGTLKISQLLLDGLLRNLFQTFMNPADFNWPKRTDDCTLRLTLTWVSWVSFKK